MMTAEDLLLARSLAENVTPLDPDDEETIVQAIGDASIVLLGEASHGTHDFYRTRARITQRLIRDKGFVAVAAEADWPDAYRVNRFVQGRSTDADAVDALGDFRRFPQWMWRNDDVVRFMRWLRRHNELQPPAAPRAGFYGLDLYSLHASVQAVLAYLDRVDPVAAAEARRRYGCLAAFGQDPQHYGWATRLELARSCEEEVVAQLRELQQRRAELVARGGFVGADEHFAAVENARVVLHAEEYYRAMFGSRVESWNLRDTHMAETLDALRAHLSRRGPAKIVVWAHNSHLGDARATELGEAGEINLGQLARERYGAAVCNLGFTTDRGSVAAAASWDAPVERKQVRPALDGSYEALFHASGVPRFLFDLRLLGEATGALAEPRLERAIGVVYQPATERLSHYFSAALPGQFDLVVHIDETRAVEPLERSAAWEPGELPETYPFNV